MRFRVKTVLITAAIFSLTVFCCAQARAELVWRADVTASSTGDANTLILGSALDATDGFENAYEARAILSGNLMAYFYHPEWGMETPYFWSDIKDPSLPGEWPFYVSSQYTGRDIVLSWALENVPDTLNLEFVDETLGLTVDMRQANSYRYFNATNVALRFFVRASGEIPGMTDSVPPDTAITSGPSGFITASSVDITFTGTDNVTPADRLSFSHNLDGGAWSGWSALGVTALSGLSNGAHTFGVKAMDEAGNEDPSPAVATFTVDVDATPPDTAITSGPSGFITASSVDITFTGTDNVTPADRLSFSHNLDGGAWSGWSALTATALSGLSNGAHTFSVKAMDEAGNEDPTPAEIMFIVDITVPWLTVNAPNPSTLSPPNRRMREVTISGNAVDGGSGLAGVDYTLTDEYGEFASSGTINASNGGFSFTLSLRAWTRSNDIDGRVYTITVIAVDNAGNKKSESVTVRVPRRR